MRVPALLAALYHAIWCLDFEFWAPDGHRSDPICLVARDLKSGREVRLFGDHLKRSTPPFDCGPDTLFVAYYSSAEMSCHMALGWPVPRNILDLFAEFRCRTNGIPLPAGRSLLGALTYYGLPAMDVVEKEEMRQLCMRGGPFTTTERADLLDYCAADVIALERLLPHLTAGMTQEDLGRALIRGRYMAAAAHMEHVGVPVDINSLSELQEHGSAIKQILISKVDQAYGVYQAGSFRAALFTRWLHDRQIKWPATDIGHPALDDDTFKDMARLHPELGPLRDLRQYLARFRKIDLSIGRDARNRTLLSTFRSITGRNQPSNSRFIFGAPRWMRGLIQPPPGLGLAYIDWSQQEFGIAAALSGDEKMMAAYRAGDPYRAFACQTGRIKEDTPEDEAKRIRALFKACILAVGYGMGANSLANRLGCSSSEAQQLLNLHQRTYPRYWRWAQGAVDQVILNGHIAATFGWTLHLAGEVNVRSLQNFPAQANGAEMMRIAAILAMEAGIEVCAPVHDAFLIQAAETDLQDKIMAMQSCMKKASEIVLDGFPLRTDVRLLRHPERFLDDDSSHMWNRVWSLIARKKSER